MELRPRTDADRAEAATEGVTVEAGKKKDLGELKIPGTSRE